MRVYDDPGRRSGRLFLVERLWPRGVRKDDLRDATWLKDVAPSAELRMWFGHDPRRWEEFRRRYRAELANGPAHAALQEIRREAVGGEVTLLYSARDEEHNSAVVLAEELDEPR
ncbi:MAG TPA: DUF488 family protein [Mycobacteriales bacterium]|nr:DUF488 family protein [Mycobacteriales bacterium]